MWPLSWAPIQRFRVEPRHASCRSVIPDQPLFLRPAFDRVKPLIVALRHALDEKISKIFGAKGALCESPRQVPVGDPGDLSTPLSTRYAGRTVIPARLPAWGVPRCIINAVIESFDSSATPTPHSRRTEYRQGLSGPAEVDATSYTPVSTRITEPRYKLPPKPAVVPARNINQRQSSLTAIVVASPARLSFAA